MKACSSLAYVICTNDFVKGWQRQAIRMDLVTNLSEFPGRDVHTGMLSCRIGGQRALRGWHFIKDHNPLWAARVFGQGIKRVPSVLLRPNWHRSRPVISRHASAVSIHVRNAWNNRPAMPRPHYRLKQQAIEQRAARQYVDVASFYILAVRL